MNRTETEDAHFDALLQQVVSDKFHAEVNSAHSVTLENEILLSPEFELRMLSLFVRERRKSRAKTVFRRVRKTVIAAAVIIAFLFGLLMINSDIRAYVRKTVIEWFDKYISINFSKDSSAERVDDQNPEDYITGYSVISKEVMGRGATVEMESLEGIKLRIRYMPSDGSANHSVDNENHTVKISEINGNEAFLVTSSIEGENNSIMWNANGYRLTIWSTLSVEEIKEIAEKIFER